jgi:hypothetical protein
MHNPKLKILGCDTYAHNIKLYQTDIKSTFLNGYINEEVYIEQPPDFEDDKKSDHVYKLKKALYDLLSKGFMIDTTLFT